MRVFFLPVPAHSWCSKEGLAALKLFAPQLLRSPPSSIPAALSLPSITPDCIWQMPLLAPYHQVWWRQPKTILLCRCTVAPPLPSILPFPFRLYFTWLTFLLLRFRGQRRGSRLRAASRVLCSAHEGRIGSKKNTDNAPFLCNYFY